MLSMNVEAIVVIFLQFHLLSTYFQAPFLIGASFVVPFKYLDRFLSPSTRFLPSILFDTINKYAVSSSSLARSVPPLLSIKSNSTATLFDYALWTGLTRLSRFSLFCFLLYSIIIGHHAKKWYMVGLTTAYRHRHTTRERLKLLSLSIECVHMLADAY